MKFSLIKALVFLIVLMKKRPLPTPPSSSTPTSSPSSSTPTSSPASSPSSSPSSSSSSSSTSSSTCSGSHSGDGTFYNPGLGACGQTDDDQSMIVALNAPDFDPSTPNGNPNKNSLCGRQIRICYNGKTVVATIEDRCPECASGAIDMSPAVFNQLADPSVGRLHGVQWDYI
ncbi:11848_t:CDS:2 [Ambispora leptoticha]|uniref:11848_t:CDS:1 n=1 Tax=Ambispora leptoticha TaxID=144679 RepID=A0A9N9FDH0_9GLOM|nr:11848_t:CDS:2 [Ambispora leptoticha]